MPGADRLVSVDARRLGKLLAVIFPWDSFPDDVLLDIADRRDGVTQFLVVRGPGGERIRTDPTVARMVLEVRSVIRSCTQPA